MSRPLVIFAAMLAAALSAPLRAATLGDLALDSALGQPLQAELLVLEAENVPLSSLQVRVAALDAYNKVGVQRLEFLQELKFQLVRKPGENTRVLISTEKAVNELMATLLLQLRAGSETELRKYTLMFLGLPPATKKSEAAKSAASAGQKGEYDNLGEAQPFAGRQVFKGSKDLGVLTLGTEMDFYTDPIQQRVDIIDRRLDSMGESLRHQSEVVGKLETGMKSLHEVVSRQNDVLSQLQERTAPRRLRAQIDDQIVSQREAAAPALQARIDQSVRAGAQSSYQRWRQESWDLIKPAVAILALILIWIMYRTTLPTQASPETRRRQASKKQSVAATARADSDSHSNKRRAAAQVVVQSGDKTNVKPRPASAASKATTRKREQRAAQAVPVAAAPKSSHTDTEHARQTIWRPTDRDGSTANWSIKDVSSSATKRAQELNTEVPATRLELVRAYLELCDSDGAQRIIKDIETNGDKVELARARALFIELA